MKITLLSSRAGYGLGAQRYTLELWKQLNARHDISLILSGKGGRIETLYKNSLIVLKILKSKSHIYHVLLPPFVYRPGKPLVITFHDANSHLGPLSSNLLTRTYTLLALKLIKDAEAVIAVSSQTSKEIEKYLEIDRSTIYVIPLGVSKEFRPLPKHEIARFNKKFTVGYLGNYDRRKNVSSLIRAFSKIQGECFLVLAGNPLGISNILPALKSIDPENYKVLGFIPEKDLCKIYNAFDVFVYPSSYEGFGLPILESQRCGIPTIIYKWPRIPEEVSQKCLKVEDERELIGKILELKENISLRKRVAEEGYNYSMNFTWERTVRETEKVYLEVVG